MVQTDWGRDIGLKYNYINENIGEIKTYTLTKEELEKYLSEPKEVKYRRNNNE
jgi:hypothetical protein